MHLRKLGGTSAAALVVFVLAGCGGSGASDANAGVTPAAYVRSICTAVQPFVNDVVRRSDKLNSGTLPSVAQGKKAIQGFLSGVSNDTDVTISKLKAAGAPKVSNGRQLADKVVSAFTHLKTSVNHALNQANALPTDTPAHFKTAATRLGGTVRTSMSGIGTSLNGLTSPELEKAAAKEPACTSLAKSGK